MAPMISWVDSANTGDTDFPLENLPYGSIHAEEDDHLHAVVAIGDQMLDLTQAERDRVFTLSDAAQDDLFFMGDWDEVMGRGPDLWAALRARLTAALTAGSDQAETLRPYLRPRHGARMALPFYVTEFTDFYSSFDHASNVGVMFRGFENALPPNWLSMPIGYNGRASSVVASGTPVTRPWGQTRAAEAELPALAPSARFDFELEMGAVIGVNRVGPLSVAEADKMIFGYVLLNDWSARDIQAWEYVPLGPFQSKATATTMGPWIVTAAALVPFRRPVPARKRAVLPHLVEPFPSLYDIDLSVTLTPEGKAPSVITRTNTGHLYWSAAQQVAHHASSGCPMRVGDLLGSGTVSGPEPEMRGCLLELGWGGKEPVTLDSGDTRTFLEDGDTVTFHGAAQGAGYRVGFGACSGQLKPALSNPWKTT